MLSLADRERERVRFINSSRFSRLTWLILCYPPQRGRSFKELKSLRQECEIQRHLHHPNIVQMLDSFETENEVFLITHPRTINQACIPRCFVECPNLDRGCNRICEQRTLRDIGQRGQVIWGKGTSDSLRSGIRSILFALEQSVAQVCV